MLTLRACPPIGGNIEYFYHVDIGLRTTRALTEDEIDQITEVLNTALTSGTFLPVEGGVSEFQEV